ncbi:MAG TPA: ATP-binding cassette domain-containing protein [Propylenella sp.]
MSNGGTVERGLLLRNVAIRLDGDELVTLDAAIGPGEVLTVMGPSGVGKSTLVAFVGGFLGRDFRASGNIILNGRDVTALPPEERSIGLLFQDALLLPHLSVAGNLLVGLDPAVKGRAVRRRAAEAALAEVGLEGFADRDPATLSGGQAARVALMRTLLARPQALVLDEPFSRLDVARRAQVRNLVFAECRKYGLPVLLVTHDPADAEAAGGRILELR